MKRTERKNTESFLKKVGKLLRNEKAQASIFLGMSLLVIVSFIAFVINVGLFVKAKINLQNAVDASAYAGAATQARQLTNIAYLNWEMRNTYKEWLMKYYVFGNIGLDAIEDIEGTESNATRTSPLNQGGMNFRLRQFIGNSGRFHKPELFDRYNAPSICIHYGSSNNICEIVSLPGLPRFNTVGLPGISAQHESSLNRIVDTKSTDCADRSSVNQGAAILWTYGTGDGNFFPGAPEIASTRPGAWVQSLELALRMRNLEAIMNTPPQRDYICLDPSVASASGSPCALGINSLSQFTTSLPFYERINKAFWSGLRNLSGGDYKENGDSVDFAGTFALREIPPNPFTAQVNSLSGFLIPAQQSLGALNSPLLKYYVDIKLMPINYALFYTSFFSTTGTFANTTTLEEGKCGGTKTALPVPGYILGFYKNPEVMTYYAVEGQAKFTGLFFPFLRNQEDLAGITLKTYAAAKPFGGRLGPMLFEAKGPQTIIRKDPKLSANYASSLNILPAKILADSQDYDDKKKLVSGGYPIPATGNFWLDSSSTATSAVVGGNPLTTNAQYVLPNLIYDFNSYSDIGNLGVQAAGGVLSLAAAANEQMAYEITMPEAGHGLYDKEQFKLFRAKRANPAGVVFSDSEIIQSVVNVRSPTRYEALNYLVPVLDQNGNNPLNMDGNSYIHPVSVTSSTTGHQDPQTTHYALYAPFINPSGLYKDENALQQVITNYLDQNQNAIQIYLDSLKQISDIMIEIGNDTRGGDSYTAAAQTIYNEDISDCSALAMAQKFQLFFSTNDEETCGIKPLALLLAEHYSSKKNEGNWGYYYTAEYKIPDPNGGLDQSQLLSAYRPGIRQGVNDPGGNYGSPFSAERISGKRNSYSTKFFPINDILAPAGRGSLPTMSEGSSGEDYVSNSESTTRIENFIPPSELSSYGLSPLF